MGSLPTPTFDPRYIKLVKTITAKTREGRLEWQRTGTGTIASAAAGLEFNFVFGPGSGLADLISGRWWALFTIRDRDGNEILKVTQERSAVVPGPLPQALLGGSESPLKDAVTELFGAVQQAARDKLDDIIDAIDQI